MDWRGLPAGGPGHRKEVVPEKDTVFVIEKYIENARQYVKHVPDLVEAIMRLTCLVKEVLRRNLMNMGYFFPP